MKATAILKDLSEVYFNGNGGSIVGLLNVPDADKLAYLQRSAQDLQITFKVGNGSFRDKVELNQILREPHSTSFKLEPRRGYKLATFEFLKT